MAAGARLGREKFPFLVANFHERYPHATIIILDGGGYKKQADLWLRAQIDGKLLHVFNMQEFQKMVEWGELVNRRRERPVTT
jgi:hypothetical protein